MACLPSFASLVLAALLSPPDTSTDLTRVRVAFTSARDGAEDIFVMSGDGSFPTRLTPCSDPDAPEGWIKCVGPAWSPDAERIAFHVYREDAPRAIYVMRADGSERRALIDDRDAVDAAWSPDGKQIAFQSDFDLWLVPSKGGEPSRLTEMTERARHPWWAPDGTRIVFCAGNFRGGALFEEIYVVDLASGQVTQLTELGGETSLPSWSPDGRWIAFNRGDDDAADVCVMRPDGSELRPLASTGKLYGASWSPDMKELYAVGFFDENSDVYALGIDGRTLRRLSDHPGRENWVRACPQLRAPHGDDPKRVNRNLDVAELEARNAIDVLRRGNLLLREGRFADAAHTFREVLERDPGFGRVWLRLGVALHQAGEADEAMDAYAKATGYERYARTAYYNLACLHATHDRLDEAFDALEHAFAAGPVAWRQVESDPDLEALRSDPRFARLKAAHGPD